ncbi:MAG: pyridoxamine 5'-phosphate oxidase family protein [Rhodobacteraceae bacterium]|nr:pyridoxamine 5'-phosphate oxidase family protein [Paracoccaceae bacterium]
MSEWHQSLDGMLGEAWRLLARGVANSRAASRSPSLATTGLDGWPASRIVTLRRADRGEGTLEVLTDFYAAKTKELQADPRAAVLIWEPRMRLQIRLHCTAAIFTGPVLANRWKRLPKAAQMNYGTTPAPGAPIGSALAYEKSPNAGSFAVLSLRVEAMDLLYLGDEHCRARYGRAGAWQGQWLCP